MPVQRSIVLGGSRSGKSIFAEGLVTRAPAPWHYIATAQAFDSEMQARIDNHRDRRGDGWRTVEAPMDVPHALAKLGPDNVVLLDCVTLWLSNHLLADSDLQSETDRLIEAINGFSGRIVVVSNEVGFGLVPDTRLGRRFRDAQGTLNQRIAAICNLAVLVVAGLPVVLKGTLPDPSP